MASENNAQGDGGRLDNILAALQKSADKTVKYFTWTFVFYVLLIAVFAVLVLTLTKPGDIGILVLVSLGFLGMWISPLRGLKGSGVGIGGFLSLFHLPLKGRIEELKDASGWSSPEERLRRAEECLDHQAAAEKEMRAWPNRLLSLVVITVIDLLIWLWGGEWVMALINQCIAMVVSQAHITMASTASLKALESLRSRSN
ncbi:MAG: hypothetical protein JJE48_09375 [Actinobacteria bacterium]|nr:hypothetical protein [Actinomycetota bacterium]